MKEILRDSIWQFIGVLLAIIAIGISITIYFLQRSKKSLSYEIIYNSALLSVKEQIKKELQILYKGLAVENVQLVILSVINDGNTPILTSDYEKPLKFVFAEEAKILSAEIINLNPQNIDLSINFRENELKFSPTLLNSNDSVIVKVLLSSEEIFLDSDARIIGVKRIRQIFDNSDYIFRLNSLFALGALTFVVVSTPTIYSSLENFNLFYPIYYTAGFIVAIGMFITNGMRRVNREKRLYREKFFSNK